MSLAPGARLGPYEVVGLIGAGGMGEVYRATDTRLRRSVAIKILLSGFASDPARLALFEREARAVAALSHPNVIAIHDVGTQDGVPFLVSELLEGRTLRERLVEGPLSTAKAVEIATQMARGLAAAHEKGIVHGDIKPENLFVARDGTVKILDFGIAQFAENSWADALTRTQALDTNPGGGARGTIGVRGLVSVSIGKVGSSYVLTGRIIEPASGETVRSYIHRAGTADDVLTVIGALATSVRRDLGESLAAIQKNDRALPQVTTSSLQALSQYAEAAAQWSRGKYNEAMNLYAAAIKADPDFAMAHAALGIAYRSHLYSQPVEARAHLERAMRLSERTTQREAQVIEIEYENLLGRFDRVRALSEIYLKQYPDDWMRRFNYAATLNAEGAHEEAIAQYREVLRGDPSNASAWINVATAYSTINNTGDALKAYARAFELQPEWLTAGNLNHEYGFTLVRSGDLAKAEEVFTKGLAAANKPLSMRSLALLDMYRGRYGRAQERFREAILLNQAMKFTLPEARNWFFLATARRAAGDARGSLAALDRSRECLRQTTGQAWLAARIGVEYARLGALAKATSLEAVTRKELQAANISQSGDLHWLQGEQALARDSLAQGLELVQLADREAHTPLTQESVARALRLAGQREPAIAAYEALLAETGKSLGWEAQQGWIDAHYSLATLYRDQGAPGKAIPLLDSFLARWSEADRRLPLLERAKRLRADLRVP